MDSTAIHEDCVDVYVNDDAMKLGVLAVPGSSFRLELNGGGSIAFDFTHECDDSVEFSLRHDGTLLFIYQCFEYCLNKMVADDQSAEYIVGKITRTEEFDKDGTKFAPKDKPWCRERTTFIIDYTKKAAE